MRLDPNRVPSGIICDGELRVHAARREQATHHLTSGPFLLDEAVLMIIESVSSDQGEPPAPVADILRPRLVFRLPAVFVEGTRFAICDYGSALLDECTDLM